MFLPIIAEQFNRATTDGSRASRSRRLSQPIQLVPARLRLAAQEMRQKASYVLCYGETSGLRESLFTETAAENAGR
jgi:hypothetical protein